MEPEPAIPFPEGVAKIVRLEALRESDTWHRAFANQSKDHRYYELINRTLAGQFEHYYAVLEDRAGSVRAVQPIFLVRQNLVEGVPGKIRKIVDFIRKKFPRFLTMRVLMIGCAAGEGQLGVIDPSDEPWLAEALPPVLRSFAKQQKASLIVWKDFPAKYRSAMAALTENNYVRVPSMPMTWLGIDYKSFDDYLGQIGYVSRKSLRRKFRKTERAAKIAMEVVTDIAPWIDEVYPLYLSRSAASCRTARAFSSSDEQEKLSRSVWASFPGTRFTTNVSASITMSRSSSIFIFTPFATSLAGQ